MLNKSTIRNLFLAASATLVMGCVAIQPVAKTVTQPAAAQRAMPADAVALLRQASYPLDDPFGSVTLVDGKFEGKPAGASDASRATAGLLEELVTSGDLNGDGQAEAVAPVWISGGGSGTFSYLAVMTLAPDKATALATTVLGDRVQVKKVAVVDGKIVLTMVQPGENEPLCCGTETVEQQYTLQGNTLKQTDSQVLIPVIADRLSNATYTIPLADDKPAAVQLKQGRWEGQPSQGDSASRPVVTLDTQADTHAVISGLGDLNGDGVAEVLAVVSSDFGGSGVFPHIVVMTQAENGSLSQLATVALEDRTQVQSLAVDNGKVLVQALTHGANDPLCCPSQSTELSFTLQDGKLVPVK